MKRFVCLSLILLGLFVSLVPAGAVPGDTGHLVVLMYHRFDAGGAISTPMSEFKRQMRYLESEDYNFVTLEAVRRHLQDNEPFPEKSVFVTIDDGYESTYTKAYPFLKKEGIPWTLYVYTEAIDRDYSSSLSWDQIREMVRHDVSVGNHTYSHRHPTREAFKSGDWIEREIVAPHRRLESKLGAEVNSFAIPYGEYDTRLLEVLREEGGYEFAWGIDPGVVDPRSDQFVLPRFGINGSTGWTEFKKKLNRLPLGVESVKPVPGSPVDSDGDTIRVTLSNPDRYREGPINVFLSELGGLEWSWGPNGRTLIISYEESLETSWNRIIITAYDQEYGRYRFFSKGFPTKSSE